MPVLMDMVSMIDPKQTGARPPVPSTVHVFLERSPRYYNMHFTFLCKIECEFIHSSFKNQTNTKVKRNQPDKMPFQLASRLAPQLDPMEQLADLEVIEELPTSDQPHTSIEVEQAEQAADPLTAFERLTVTPASANHNSMADNARGESLPSVVHTSHSSSLSPSN